MPFSPFSSSSSRRKFRGTAMEIELDAQLKSSVKGQLLTFGHAILSARDESKSQNAEPERA